MTIYTVTGTLSHNYAGAIFDKPIPVGFKRVRITFEALPEENVDNDFMLLLDQIHARLSASGYIAPTREEVDSDVDKERDSWDF